RPVPVLRGVLHAAVLGRAGSAAREPVRRVRAVRRRADPGELPRDPPRERFHPSRRLHAQGTADDRDNVRGVLRRVGRDARACVDLLQAGAHRQAARRAAARAARGSRVSAGEKYVAAVYLVVFLVVLAWVLIIATKLARLEREVAEMAERARLKQREPEELPPGEPAPTRG